MQLPQAQPGTAGLYVADYSAVAAISSPGAGGVCRIVFGPVDPARDHGWLVTHMAISCTSTNPTSAEVHIGTEGDESQLTLAAASSTGNLDFDDVTGDGLLAAAGDAITVVWSGADDGATAVARLQYKILRQA